MQIDFKKPMTGIIKEDLRLFDVKWDIIRIELAAALAARQDAIDKMTLDLKEIKNKLVKAAEERARIGDDDLNSLVDSLFKWQDEIDYQSNMKESAYFLFVTEICKLDGERNAK